MTLRPDHDLADHLRGELGDLALGKNLFIGPVRPVSDHVPARAVFVMASGGPSPEAMLEPAYLRSASLDIRIRGESGNYMEGSDLAIDVRDAVHYAEITNYIDIRCIDAHPTYIGEDDSGHPEWTLTVTMLAEES